MCVYPLCNRLASPRTVFLKQLLARFLVRAVGYFIVATLALVAVDRACGAEPTAGVLPRVLVLNSYHAGYSWSDGELHGLQRVLMREFPALIPDVEFLDGKRDSSAEHAQLLFEFLLRKYQGVRFDLVVTLDDFALQFAFAHRQQLSPDAPIVFAGVNNFRREMLAGQKRVTGVVEAFDFARCFELLRKLRPKSHRVHLICDSVQGNEDTLAVFFRAAKLHGQGLEFVQLRDWTAESLPQLLAALPPDDAAFIIGIARDFAGRVVSEDANFIQAIARQSAVPIFMVNQPVLPVAYGYGWEQGLWMGVGGAMISSVRHGETAGELACRILRGEDATTIPVLTSSPTRIAFNYPLLVRHGIDLSRLPRDAEVFNRSYSFFELYWGRIFVTLGVIVLLAAAVVILMASNLRRNRAELALRRSNERLQLLMTAIEQATEQIALLNHDGTAFYANAALSRVLPPTEPGQLPNTTVLWRDASGSSQPFASVVRATTEKGSWQERISLSNNRGTATILQLVVTPIQPAPGESTRYLLIAQDVTQETRLEEQVRLSQKMDAIGTLASGIAHDFNNILSAILGNAEMVLADMPDEHPARGLMDDIRTATNRAAHLVRQILTFSRHAKPQREVLSVTPIMEELMKFLRATIPVTITLRHTVKASPHIMADPTQLYQVMLNLCTNAAQAIGVRSGVIEIVEEAVDLGPEVVSLHPGLHPGMHLHLAVRDDGCGMPQEVVSRIFEPFYTTKPPGQGTGLGLSVVHGIVRSHQAAVTVYSSPGKGTVFHLYFPVAETAIARKEIAGTRDPLPRGQGQHIIFVDDEESLTRMGARLLGPLGYQVSTFGHPQVVIENLRAGGVCDLLITDFSMPGFNAFELITQVRKIKPALRVILITGYLSDQDRAKALEFSINRILEKPLNTASLSSAVAEVLAQR